MDRDHWSRLCSRSESIMSDEYETIEAEVRSTLSGFLQLMRLPNIFTAMADVAMGFLFVKGDADLSDFWVLGVLLASSSLLYIGGVVLNDVVDHELDTIERPNRPLPSGRVTPRAACLFGGIALFVGTALGWAVALAVGRLLPGVVATLLAACVLIYNGMLKHTPLGPVAMGGCRMLNVFLGMSVIAGSFAAENWLVAGGIGLYIAGVTWFARTEATRSSRLPLVLAATMMLLGIAMIACVPWTGTDRVLTVIRNQPTGWLLLMLLMGAMIGWRCVAAIVKPDSVWVQRAVAHAVLSLIMLDASACFVIRGPYFAAAILLLMLPAMFISRRISPT
jgi:4-hydroxybenzoate polyprenyltransferase